MCGSILPAPKNAPNTGTMVFNSGSAPYTQTAGTTRLNGGSVTFGVPGLIQGGTLEGGLPGSITGSVNSSPAGTVSPGLSAGCLGLAGNYVDSGSGTLDIELGGLTACSQFDQFTMSGTAATSGTLNVTLDGFIPVVGDTFTIMTFSSRTGQFTVENLPTLPAGIMNVDYSDPTSIVLEVVPPTTADGGVPSRWTCCPVPSGNW